MFDIKQLKWWRRRESNPRPKTFRAGIYIHSLNSSFRLFKSPSGRMLDRLSCKIFRRSVNRMSGTAILLVDALTGLAGMVRQDVSLKRLKRNYNHLRLCLVSHLFLQAGRRLVCNLNFFIPVEAVSPPKVFSKQILCKRSRLYVPNLIRYRLFVKV